MVAVPRDAATVVLMREVPGIGTKPEVLMLKRHADEAFAAGAYVFPGGVLEAEDSIPASLVLSQQIPPEAAAALMSDVKPASKAFGFWIAALRETFEETGLLLARLANGELWEPTPAEKLQIAGQRRALQAGTASFATVMHDLERSLATDLLVYFAHWITPETRPMRFSTRFFLARVPSSLEVEPDRTEVVDHVWRSPEEALQRHAAGDMYMMTVTTKILQTLSQFGSAADAVRKLRYASVETVMPKAVLQHDGITRVLYPGDE
jgi:8-oxo-dGTP pyrophosphatase MutT (NUDIX family)